MGAKMGAIFEVTLVASYYNQEVINVWNYINPTITIGDELRASTLMGLLGWSEWDTEGGSYPGGTVADKFMEAVNPFFELKSVFVRDIYSTTNISEWVFPPGVAGQSTGNLAGEKCSPAVAIGFTSNRVNTEIGRGQKRLSGQTEEAFQAGGTLTPSFLASVYNPLAAAMSQALDDPAISLGSYYPAICKKERYEVEKDGVPTGRFAYKYYDDAGVQALNTAQGITWSVKTTQRFQVSRQYGRGR